MRDIKEDIEKQEEYLKVLRYRAEQIDNAYYESKFDRETMQTRLRTEEKHLQDLYTQLNKGKR